MCIQLQEICPGCDSKTGVVYRYPNHDEGSSCKLVEQGHVFVPRSRLLEFECGHPRCPLSKASCLENETKFANARKAAKEPASQDLVASVGAGENNGGEETTGTGPVGPSLALTPAPPAAPTPVGINNPRHVPPSRGVKRRHASTDEADAGSSFFDDSESSSWGSARRTGSRSTAAEPSSAQRSGFFRAKRNIRMTDLPTATQEEIDTLVTKITEEMSRQAPQQGNISRAPPTWLLEEDQLVQLLRLNRFPYTQMQTDFLTHRTRGAIEHRRMKQRQGQVNARFTYIPDENAQPEV